MLVHPPSSRAGIQCQWPEERRVLQKRFLSAQPYPHIVIDGVFPSDSLVRMYGEVPASSSSLWTYWGSGGAEDCLKEDSKRGISSLLLLSGHFAAFLQQLNSDKFLEDLREITGRSDLTTDPTFNGGGLHCTGRGGRLRIHADKVRHPRPCRFDQAVNLILFINPHWSVEFGGALELWSRDGSERIVSIPALFNRLVLFTSDRTTYHGHPEPIRCPPGMYRTSLAVYYYVPRNSPVEPHDNEIAWRVNR